MVDECIKNKEELLKSVLNVTSVPCEIQFGVESLGSGRNYGKGLVRSSVR